MRVGFSSGGARRDSEENGDEANGGDRRCGVRPWDQDSELEEGDKEMQMGGDFRIK